MNNKNTRKHYVLLSESEINNIASSFYSDLIKLPIYDNVGRIDVIKKALQHTQNGIIKNIEELNEEESKIVPQLITADLL